MASTSETGHVRNINSFIELVGICTNLGAKYAPSKATLKLTALNTLLTDAKNGMQKSITTNSAYEKARNDRAIVFKPIKQLSSKIMSALKASGADDLSIDNARTWHNKIHGIRSRAKKVATASSPANTPAPPAKRTISTSQQSFDKITENFERLIGTLINESASYAPNENEMKIATLQTLLNTMKTKNDAVTTARIATKSDNSNRDKVLYAQGTGMVDTAQAVKAYVHSVFGSDSREYKNIVKLKFTR